MKNIMFFCGIFLFPILLFSQNSISNLSKSEKLDSIVVSTARVSKNAPLTYSHVEKEQLKKSTSSHSLPLILSLQPSVVATTESGLGLGYSKLSIRGSDASRVNVTLNGITINDAESQEVFWVNLPFIQSFLQSAQVQRGVGTSSNGSAAFGGAINMQTLAAQNTPYGNAEFSYGSYQTYIMSVAAGGGVSKSGISFDARYSHSQTQGYIRNSNGELNSLFTSFGLQNNNNLFKINYIYGNQHTGITWEGISLKQYEQNRRYNPAGIYYDEAGNEHYYDNESDNYVQHHAQMFFSHKLSNSLTWNNVANYTKGDGFYENYKYNVKFSKYGLDNQVIDGSTYKKSDFIIRQGMDNYYLAVSSGLNYKTKKLNITGGVNYSFYDGDHDGTVLWSKYNNNIPKDYNWYSNVGKKSEANVFVKGEYNISKFILYAEMQYRHINYNLSGLDKDFVSLDKKFKYNFANPKIGLTYNLSSSSKFYSSVSISHREPSRSDIKESIKAKRTDDLKQERLIDYELGYKYLADHFSLSANLYFMEYKNQLAATGKLSESGYVIMENVPKSYRRGVELAFAWQISNMLRFDANLTLSKNKIKNYTAWIDTYDNLNDWNFLGQTEVSYNKTSLILSPEVISAALITFSPGRNYDFSLSGKYVGKQYMDNTQSDDSKVPAYFTSSFNASKSINIKNGSKIILSACVDNLFDNKYYSYGWVYKSFFKEDSILNVDQGVYPQARIHFIAKVAYEF